MNRRKVQEIVDSQVGDVLDVLLPHHHGVPAHGPIVVQHDPQPLVLGQHVAGAAHVLAEKAAHTLCSTPALCSRHIAAYSFGIA